MIRSLDLFTQFADIEVGMSVPTLDDRARSLLEPWAPPIDARLRCLRALADAGLTTFVGFAPCYPPTGGLSSDRLAGGFPPAGGPKKFIPRPHTPPGGGRTAGPGPRTTGPPLRL